MYKQEGLRFRKDCNGEGMKKDRENIRGLMESKLDDSLWDERKRRELRSNLRAKLERKLWKSKSEYKRYIHKVRDKAVEDRIMLKKRNVKKLRELRMEWKKEVKFILPQELKRYADAKVFKEEHDGDFVPGEVKGPVVVGGNISLLNQDEIAVLTRGPSFTIRRVLSRERFIVEIEKSYIKIRWTKQDEAEVDCDMEGTGLDNEEQARIDDIAELEEAKSRIIFDLDKKEIDYRKQRCTDVKHNAKVILPGPGNQTLERELEVRRVEWLAIYDAYVKEFCDEKGVQEDTLTPAEARGLKSLKKRVADGSLIICQTDKSGRFAVRSKEEYSEAGAKHVDKDEEVTMEFLIKNQKKLNGHMSMLLKTFNVGADWKHQARIRATKITWSLSVAPLYLLYKDHKGWTVEAGGPPPTRPVASAGGGQNDNMSETVSGILEPVASTWTGGMETKSTPGFLSKINEMNENAPELEDIDLCEVDRALDEAASMKDDSNMVDDVEIETDGSNPSPLPEPDKICKNTAKQELSCMLASLAERWDGTAFSIVASSSKRILDWDEGDKIMDIAITLLGWMWRGWRNCGKRRV